MMNLQEMVQMIAKMGQRQEADAQRQEVDVRRQEADARRQTHDDQGRDARLDEMEERQRRLAARLKLLEMQVELRERSRES